MIGVVLNAGVQGLSRVTLIWYTQCLVVEDLEMNGESLIEGVLGQTDGSQVHFLEGKEIQKMKDKAKIEEVHA